MILEKIKKLIVSLMKIMDIHSLYLLRVVGVPHEDGWFRSFREGRSVDLTGKPIPWLTYPAIEFIDNRLRHDMTVFEFGCGASTLWWAERVKEVVSCEHDEIWYQETVRNIPTNVRLYNIPLEYGGEYCRKISCLEMKFDIVVIDGRDRVNCAKNTLKALTPSGIIIWDNSDREEYKEGYQFLFDNGFRKIEFVGMIPIVSCKSETGIFYRQENCFGI